MRVLLQCVLLTLFVTASAYTPYEPGQNGIGALGQSVIPQLTIAVSRDLRHLLRRWVHIEGVGVRYVNDVMAERWRNKVDLCVEDESEADSWGVRKVKIRIVE